MATITSAIRRKLIKTLIQRAFQEEWDALCEEGAKLAQAALRAQMLEQEWALVEQLPEKWLPQANHINIYLGLQNTWIYFNGVCPMVEYQRANDSYTIPLEKPKDVIKQVPAHLTDAYVSYEVRDKFAIEFQAWLNSHKDLEQRMISMLLKLRGTLESFRSSQKLIAAWPEIEPLLTPLLPEKIQLPAIDTKSLNKVLDLPI